jgi:hypothetical protein
MKKNLASSRIYSKPNWISVYSQQCLVLAHDVLLMSLPSKDLMLCSEVNWLWQPKQPNTPSKSKLFQNDVMVLENIKPFTFISHQNNFTKQKKHLHCFNRLYHSFSLQYIFSGDTAFLATFFHYTQAFGACYIQCLQKVFTPLDSFKMLLCYSLNVKWIKCRLFCQWSTNNTPLCLVFKCKCLKSISIQLLYYGKPQ